MRDEKEEIYINVDEKQMLDKKHALLHLILRRLENATHDKNLLLTLKTESQIEDEIEKYMKQAEQERRQKEEERRQKELALAKEKETIVLSAKTLLEYNVPIEKIMQTTGLTREEIEEIKKKM
jgi:single-stranded DNA-specific DHH superfamily exonuclease